MYEDQMERDFQNQQEREWECQMEREHYRSMEEAHERELEKEAIKDIVEAAEAEFSIQKKYITKLARTIYKQNYDDIRQEASHFEDLYEAIAEGRNDTEED